MKLFKVECLRLNVDLLICLFGYLVIGYLQRGFFAYFAKDFATFAVNKKEKSVQLLTSSINNAFIFNYQSQKARK